MIDLHPDYLKIVLQILAEYVPECEVAAFGSRVRWTAKKHSDLDLVIRCQAVLSLERLGSLQEAFEESDLPMRVDVIDWYMMTENFRRIIEQDWVELWVPEAVVELDTNV